MRAAAMTLRRRVTGRPRLRLVAVMSSLIPQ